MLLRISNTLVSTLLVRKNVASHSQNFLTTFLKIGIAIFQALNVIQHTGSIAVYTFKTSYKAVSRT